MGPGGADPLLGALGPAQAWEQQQADGNQAQHAGFSWEGEEP
jgi:hypothetical protein